jgi:hypothetical protein
MPIHPDQERSMSGYHTLAPARPVHQRGRPPTPVVPMERCRPAPVSADVRPKPEPVPKAIAAIIEAPDTPPEKLPFFSTWRARTIVKLAAQRHGLTVADIMSKSRRAPIIKARHEAIAEVAEALPLWGLHKLRQFFGYSDHTSILHVLRKMGLRTGEAA